MLTHHPWGFAHLPQRAAQAWPSDWPSSQAGANESGICRKVDAAIHGFHGNQKAAVGRFLKRQGVRRQAPGAYPARPHGRPGRLTKFPGAENAQHTAPRTRRIRKTYRRGTHPFTTSPATAPEQETCPCMAAWISKSTVFSTSPAYSGREPADTKKRIRRERTWLTKAVPRPAKPWPTPRACTPTPTPGIARTPGTAWGISHGTTWASKT